jgi:hypothetical protein
MMIIFKRVYYFYHVNAIQLINLEKITISIIKIKPNQCRKSNCLIRCNVAYSNRNHWIKANHKTGMEYGNKCFIFRISAHQTAQECT